MNHQVQTSVLVNNEWVSRPIDAYHFMAHARDSDGDVAEPAAKSTSQVPELGVLSRTLFASPLFNAVRPAKVRSEHLNDFILVGEDAIHLKEIHDYGRLHHVAVKDDFKGRILATRVFGDPRQVPVSVARPGSQKLTLHRGARSTTASEHHVLPPEVLVLTLTNRTLMFLWARHSITEAVSFTQQTVRLPAGASQFDRFGPFLAIDPKRRAMAVAAYEGRFILYKTKSMHTWREEVRNGMNTTPIQDERIIPLQGRVMHMDFLSSDVAHDEFHVILLFIVVLQGRTKITCFDWDCREDLSTVTARAERISVDDLPAAILPSLLPGDSRRSPRWVQWDKPPRNPDFTKEPFYVAREDGRILYLERGTSGSEVSMIEAGDWPHRIDTAFACLTVDNSEFSQLYPDVLIAGGAGNDGRLCKVGSWPYENSYASYTATHQFSHVDTISNWTPLTDLSVARPAGSSALHEHDRSSIFVANGSSPHGEISELRQGLQSLVDHSFSGMTGCTGLWVLDHGCQTVQLDGKAARQYYAIFAVTMPPETLVIHISRNQQHVRGEYWGAWEDGVWRVEQIPNDSQPLDDGIMRDMETITACPWTDDFAIQITRSEIRVLNRSNLHQNNSMVCASPLLLAACKPGSPFVAIAFRESGSAYLQIVPISQDGQIADALLQSARMPLDHDPTCIEIFQVNGITFVLVGTFGSSMHILRLDGNGELFTVLQSSLNRAVNGGDGMVLENGYLLSTHLPVLQSDPTDLTWHAVRIGRTSGRVVTSATDSSTAFVTCGPNFCRVRCSANNSSTLDINSIWFSSRTRPGYLQSSVTALYQLPIHRNNESTDRNLSGFIFAVAGDEFHCSQLDSDITWATGQISPTSRDNVGHAPRKLHTAAKPTNLIYLRPIRKMVITTMEAREGKCPPKGYRVLHSAIKLLDIHDYRNLDEAYVKEEDHGTDENHLIVAQYELKHGERVYSITEWPFVDHRNKQYNLILVGTGIPNGSGKEVGRRLIFNVGRNEAGAKLMLKKASNLDQPVFCTAVYSNNEIISAIGKSLTLDVFDSEVGVLTNHTSIELDSPAIHVTIRNKYIHISTLEHSHMCYHIDKTSGQYEFRRLFSDSRLRNCSTHLVLDIPSNPGKDTIVLVNDKKSSSITGLYRPSTRTRRLAAPTLFEACLPRTVVRLQQGDIRPPWRRPATPTTGVLNKDDIIGACSDGTIYTLSILSEPARHVLGFLQNLIQEKDKRNPENRFSGSISHVVMHGADGNQDDKIRALDVDPTIKERGMAGPRFKAIDGDVVGRWLGIDGDIETLVREGTEANVSRMFGEFIAALFRESMTEQDGVAKVKTWLADLFMPVL
ncbi:hypothetical protein ACEQ8H_008129 [Pleosporales sp. CAS-2024a]